MGLLLFGIIIGIILKHKTRSVLVFVYDEGTKKIEKEGGGGGRNTELRLSQVFLCKIGREKTIQRTENILFDV